MMIRSRTVHINVAWERKDKSPSYELLYEASNHVAATRLGSCAYLTLVHNIIKTCKLQPWKFQGRISRWMDVHRLDRSMCNGGVFAPSLHLYLP